MASADPLTKVKDDSDLSGSSNNNGVSTSEATKSIATPPAAKKKGGWPRGKPRKPAAVANKRPMGRPRKAKPEQTRKLRARITKTNKDLKGKKNAGQIEVSDEDDSSSDESNSSQDDEEYDTMQYMIEKNYALQKENRALRKMLALEKKKRTCAKIRKDDEAKAEQKKSLDDKIKKIVEADDKAKKNAVAEDKDQIAEDDVEVIQEIPNPPDPPQRRVSAPFNAPMTTMVVSPNNFTPPQMNGGGAIIMNPGGGWFPPGMNMGMPMGMPMNMSPWQPSPFMWNNMR